MKFIPETRRTH